MGGFFGGRKFTTLLRYICRKTARNQTLYYLGIYGQSYFAPYVSTDLYKGIERQAPASWGASYPIEIKTTKTIKTEGAKKRKK